MPTVSLLVIHHQRLVGECLASYLSQLDTVRSARAVSPDMDFLAKIRELQPDLVVVEILGYATAASEPANIVHGTFPDLKMLAIGPDERGEDLRAAIEVGATGYASHTQSLEDLARNVSALASGEPWCSPRVSGFLFAQLTKEVEKGRNLSRATQTQLTPREIEVISLVDEGLSNKEIAVELSIELQTVKNHVHNILEKLQLRSRHAAARYARDGGLLEPSRRSRRSTGTRASRRPDSV